jgi:hypothetical protein
MQSVIQAVLPGVALARPPTRLSGFADQRIRRCARAMNLGQHSLRKVI